MTFGGSPMTQINIFGGSKMPILGVKNAKICKYIYFLLQMATKVIWWSSMTQIYIFRGWMKTHFGGKKWQNVQKLFMASNASKCYLGVSHDQNLYIWGGQKCPFWGTKMPKFEKIPPKAPPSHLEVSHYPNVQHLHIFLEGGGQNCPF